ncbi:MAG: ECF transporter S component [Clostridiales bacterium]|nr:ECF transporter S component [Clostridiales bacterium]
MNNKRTLKITMAAMFMAIGMVLPFITGQIPAVANMLLPMHFPVLLCGMICGPAYGAVIGAILPLFRCLLFHMPKITTAIPMSFELMTYGLVIGLVYQYLSQKRRGTLFNVYASLIIAMIAGRIVWALPKYLVLTYWMGENKITFTYFITETVLNAVLGIVLQLVLIPLIMKVLEQTHLLPNRNKKNESI